MSELKEYLQTNTATSPFCPHGSKRDWLVINFDKFSLKGNKFGDNNRPEMSAQQTQTIFTIYEFFSCTMNINFFLQER